MNNFLRSARIALPIVILSIFVTIVSSRRPLYDGYYKARFSDMIQGTAWQPFVDRCFVPFLIRSGEALLPRTIEAKISGFLEQYPFVAAASQADSYKVERVIYLGINIFALICF